MITSPSTSIVNLTVNGTHQCCISDGDLQGRKVVYAPAENFIMMSVNDFACHCTRYVKMYSQGQRSFGGLVWRGCDDRYSNTNVLQSNVVTLQWNFLFSCKLGTECIAVLFSFLPKSKAPQRLSSGLYNCSVDYYWRFQQHLDCNLKVECEDGRDEGGHCPFSSPTCRGWVALRNKCYVYVIQQTLDRSVKTEPKPYIEDVKLCSSMNASLATFTSSRKGKSVLDTFKGVPLKAFFKWPLIGVTYGALSVPNLYRRSLINNDKRVLHHSFTAHVFYEGEEVCFSMYIHPFRPSSSELTGRTCSMVRKDFYSIICEATVYDRNQNNSKSVHLLKPPFGFRNGKVNFTKCPNGEMMHVFLSCYTHNACGQTPPHRCTFFSNTENTLGNSQGTRQFMTSVPVFTCRDGVIRLPYTLVCDFRHHCTDGSDETFCQYPPCAAFACSNGQCVSYIKRCDTVSDCLDDSDELMCFYYTQFVQTFREIRSPAVINFDGNHSFEVEKMNISETCPETHYRCPGEHNDCLPVFTLCNGWYDCVDKEDERDCKVMLCPGFYRCFNSTICVHAHHLCDGWPHCPQHDDEWLCDMTCPAQCLCQGHAFLCSRSFPAHLFAQLRYLDAGGSGMKPSDLDYNSYIVHLSLAQCSIGFLPVMTFLNLLFLDVSSNNLTVFNITAFSRLVNLRTLSLAKNPIDLIYCDSSLAVQLSALHTVDLSHSKLTVFDSKALSNMMYVQSLNLSCSTIHTIHPNGFRYTPRLTHLYLAGNPINTFSADLFKSLALLHTLSSETYKLCCREVLPDHTELITCSSPKDEISSCEDLLQSGMYRSFLWLISSLALLGNVFGLVVRVCVHRTPSATGFHVFVTNLSISDLLMGVYVAVIGVADFLYRGKYFLYDKTWRHTVACKVAGCMSLLSCEVSALIIWLITLDRSIVLRFPFSSVRFQRNSAAVACLITWFVGFLLALVPLFPGTSHWEFFSQTSICIPLPVTRQDFKGKVFSFGVFIVFNFILFVLIAGGQVFIYWSVQQHALNTDSAKVSRDLTIARRLISVAVTDFLCWFPVGMCGLISLADIAIPGEVNVALAIFVLPLNSALNPFMYTFNMLRDKRRKAKEAVLLQWLESQSNFQI